MPGTPLKVIERRCSRCGTGRLSLPNDPSDSCPECHCKAWHDTKRYWSAGLIQAIRGESERCPILKQLLASDSVATARQAITEGDNQ